MSPRATLHAANSGWTFDEESSKFGDDTTQVRTTTDESGSYEDLVFPFGIAIRVQSGQYDTTQSTDTFSRTGEDTHFLWAGAPEEEPTTEESSTKRETVDDSQTKTTHGWYDVYGNGGSASKFYQDYEEHKREETDGDYTDFQGNVTHYYGHSTYDVEIHITPDSAEGHGREAGHGVAPGIGPYDHDYEWDVFDDQTPPTPPQNPPATSNQTHSFEALVLDVAEDAARALVNTKLNENPALRALGLLGAAAIAEVAPGSTTEVNGPFGPDKDGDGYTDSWLKRPLQWLMWGPYQKVITNSPGLDAGDRMTRSGQNAHDALGQAARESGELIAKVAKESVLAVGTEGLGAWLSRFDEVNEVRQASKLRNEGKFAEPLLVRLGKLKPFIKDNFRENLAILTGKIPAGAEAHHVLPQAFEEFFLSKGLNIHNPAFGAWWNAKDHAGNAKLYEELWEAFILEHSNASRKAILDEARDLAQRFGLDVIF